jgi:hypothetical protein
MSPSERQAAIARFERSEQINAQTRIQAEKSRQSGKQAKEEATDFERKCREKSDPLDVEACESRHRQGFKW